MISFDFVMNGNGKLIVILPLSVVRSFIKYPLQALHRVSNDSVAQEGQCAYKIYNTS